jgi:hypothetical protein
MANDKFKVPKFEVHLFIFSAQHAWQVKRNIAAQVTSQNSRLHQHQLPVTAFLI